MNTREALLRAVLRDPEDDTVRLAYADYLDETGTHTDRDHAEFIRLQVAIANGMRTGARAAQRRVLSLFKTYSNELFYATPCPGLSWGFSVSLVRRPYLTKPAAECVVYGEALGAVRRGFLDAVRCTSQFLFGGTCWTCAMVGGPDPAPIMCPTCRNRRVVPETASALFAAQPITRLELTDKRPFAILVPTAPHDRAEWMLCRSKDPRREDPYGRYCVLPPAVFGYLTGFSCSTPESIGYMATKRYRTDTGAREALSRAVVDACRVGAGFAPLYFKGD